MTEQIFLSRKNLETLLNKLNRNKEDPGASQCTLLKCDNKHKKYPQSMPEILVTAVENDDYYTDRDAGYILPIDDPANVPNRKS